MKKSDTRKSRSEEILIVTNSSWRFQRVSENLLSLIRSMWFDTDVKVGDALGPHWTLTLCTIKSGRAKFFHGQELVDCPARFAMFMPAYCLVRGVYEGVHMTATGLVWFGEEPEGFPSEPTIFQPPSWELPRDLRLVKKYVSAGTLQVKVNALSGASALTMRAKREIDRSFRSEHKLSLLAVRLKTTPAYLSRVFKRESGFSLSEYRTQMRVSTAALALLRHRAIADVYQDVGFSDLSRFYKQFRKVTTATPGAYQGNKKTKNAKT